MKLLQNNFTTPEQSKRLLELGVPADSADCFFTDSGKMEIKNTAFDILYTPCWSVGRLMEIFDICYFGSRKNDEWPKTNEMSSKARSIVDYIVGIYEIAAKENGLDFSKLEE